MYFSCTGRFPVLGLKRAIWTNASVSSCWVVFLLAILVGGASPISLLCQSPGVGRRDAGLADNPQSELETPEAWNLQLERLVRSSEPGSVAAPGEYRIGPEDVLDITVLEAPELDRSVRVGAGGQISLPLIGTTKAAGLTPRQLEIVLEELLRRTYMKDPHVGVFVRQMQSHPVSVLGAVNNPGVFQIRGTKNLTEILALAGGLAEDAGDTVLVVRGEELVRVPDESAMDVSDPSPDVPEDRIHGTLDGSRVNDDTIEISLKSVLESGNTKDDILVYPGDTVKVPQAGIIYVVGDVNKPGGYVLRSRQGVSVLQALALAEGANSTAATGRSMIIRMAENGERTEVAVDIGKILKGEAPNPILQPNDILFVPSSRAKAVAYRGVEAVVRTLSGLIIFSGR